MDKETKIIKESDTIAEMLVGILNYRLPPEPAKGSNSSGQHLVDVSTYPTIVITPGPGVTLDALEEYCTRQLVLEVKRDDALGSLKIDAMQPLFTQTIASVHNTLADSVVDERSYAKRWADQVRGEKPDPNRIKSPDGKGSVTRH